MTPFLYGIEARELTWDLMEILCGARVTSNYVRIGGVKHDMPPSFPAKCVETVARIRQLLVDFIARIRDEQRFDGVEALVAQIGADATAARALLEEASRTS